MKPAAARSPHRMNVSNKKRRPEQGYILLTLMLFVTLLAIASLAWIEKFDFQIKRDREEELIHRGVQYSRAIRRYVRKFGRYPARLEDLESTNNVRYLRKRYKDPITGKDFKLLRQNDVQMTFSPGAASGLAPGSPAAQAGAPGSLNANPASPGGAQPGPVSAGPQGQPGSSDAQQTADSSSPGADPSSQNPAAGSNGAAAGSPAAPQSGPGNPGGQAFGGLPIVGVASISKDKTIREFNKKSHYNEWQFVYDPSTDRGGLLSTPNQPGSAGQMGVGGVMPGAPGFGAGMNPGGMTPGGAMNPPQPVNPPQQNQH